jgi:proteasome maturation protein
MLGNVYGAHVPMRKRMELGIVSSIQRLPGLPSSNFGLEILLNKHEDLDFDDFLADPQLAGGDAVDVHLAMEKRLGMDRPLGAKPVRAVQLAGDSSVRSNRAAVRDV